MHAPIRTALSLALLAGLLSACQPDAQPQAEQAAATPAATAAAQAPAVTSNKCPADAGTAPAGDLVAQRITSADGDGAGGLYEGPVWTNGALYFSDFRFSDGFPSKIRKLDGEGVLSTAIDNSGSNGLALGTDGALIAATHDRKELSRYDLGDGARTHIVGQYQGNGFNSPNDLVVSDDGTVWFTDPDFQRAASPGEQDKTRVYRVGTDGVVSVVDDSIYNPNGIALSPDGNTLYVAGGMEQGVLRAYPIVDGQAGAGRDLTSTTVPDGLAVDCLGNIYLTEHTQRRVRVISPNGQQIANISVDANVTNATFGGDDRRTLYITGAGAVWKLESGVAGLPY